MHALEESQQHCLSLHLVSMSDTQDSKASKGAKWIKRLWKNDSYVVAVKEGAGQREGGRFHIRGENTSPGGSEMSLPRTPRRPKKQSPADDLAADDDYYEDDMSSGPSSLASRRPSLATALSPSPAAAMPLATGPNEPTALASPLLSRSESREELSPAVLPSGPFERGLRGSLTHDPSMPPVPLVEADKDYIVMHDTRVRHVKDPLYQIVRSEATYYRRHFLDRDHWNYFSTTPGCPLIMSVRLEDGFIGDEDLPHVRVVLRTLESTRRQLLPVADLPSPLRPSAILTALDSSLSVVTLAPVLSRGEDPTTILVDMDEHRVHDTWKIALLAARDDHMTEEMLLGSDDLPASIGPFLDMLCGTRAARAGIIDTTWDGNQILFHAPALIARDATGGTAPRRRHIAHCTVALVFLDGSSPLRTEIFSSHLLHVLVVVRPAGLDRYRVSVAQKTTVAWFDPPCEDGQLFSAGPELRQFLLIKLMNAEISATQTETFTRVARRTRETLLTAAVETFAAQAGRAVSPAHTGSSIARNASMLSVNTSAMTDAALVSSAVTSLQQQDQRQPTPSPTSQRSTTDDGRRSGDELSRHLSTKVGSFESRRGDDGEAGDEQGDVTIRRSHSRRRPRLSRNASATSVDRESTTPEFLRVPSDMTDPDRECILGQGDAAVFVADLPRLDAPALREMVLRLHQTASTLRREQREMVEANLKLRRKIADLKQSSQDAAARIDAATKEHARLSQRIRELEAELDAPAEV